MKPPISLVQIRMARAALNWSSGHLAQEAGLPRSPIHRALEGQNLQPAMVAKLQAALEAAGIVFFAEGETVTGGTGVMLRTATVIDPIEPDGPAVAIVKLVDCDEDAPQSDLID